MLADRARESQNSGIPPGLRQSGCAFGELNFRNHGKLSEMRGRFFTNKSPASSPTRNRNAPNKIAFPKSVRISHIRQLATMAVKELCCRRTISGKIRSHGGFY
jgi:hypothetical protein